MVSTENLRESDKQPKLPREWSLYLMNVQTNSLMLVDEGLSKSHAMLLVRKWNASKTDCVLFAWPEWVPEPVGMQIAGQPPCQAEDCCTESGLKAG